MSIMWLAGQSGSGKTTLAKKIISFIREDCSKPILLDGDEMRATINRELGFSSEDRRENNLRIARLAQLLHKQGNDVIVAVIAPYKKVRREITDICNPEWFWIDRGLLSTKDRPFEDFDKNEKFVKIIKK